MDNQIVKGKWAEFKGEVRKLWGEITDNDLEQTKGNVKAIGGLIQQKFGQLKDDSKSSFDSLVKRYGQDATQTTENVKQGLRDDVNKHN